MTHDESLSLAREAREVAEKATVGPWTDMTESYEVERRIHAEDPNWQYTGGPFSGEVRSCADFSHICSDPEMDDRPHDRAFIAAARDLVPRLADALEETIARAEDQRIYITALSRNRDELLSAVGLRGMHEVAPLVKRLLACEAALRELVELKNLEDRLNAAVPTDWRIEAKAQAEREPLMQDYLRRKPIAWEASRKALEESPTDSERDRLLADLKTVVAACKAFRESEYFSWEFFQPVDEIAERRGLPTYNPEVRP